MAKVILTDVDEVLLDWATPFQEWVRSHYPEHQPTSCLRDHWHIEAWLNCPIEHSRELIRRFNGDPDIWPNFQPLPGAVEAIDSLTKDGWRFVAITACAEDDDTVKGRWKNLRNVFGDAFDTLHCVGLSSSKAPYLKRYRETYWIEDKIKHAVDGADLGHFTFIVDYKHNEKLEDPRIVRVDHWDEIRDHIEKRENQKK